MKSDVGHWLQQTEVIKDLVKGSFCEMVGKIDQSGFQREKRRKTGKMEMQTVLSVNSVVKESVNWNSGWKQVSLCVSHSIVSDSGQKHK